MERLRSKKSRRLGVSEESLIRIEMRVAASVAKERFLQGQLGHTEIVAGPELRAIDTILPSGFVDAEFPVLDANAHGLDIN